MENTTRHRRDAIMAEMKARLAQVGGALQSEHNGTGTGIVVTIPLAADRTGREAAPPPADPPGPPDAPRITVAAQAG
jgi:hypothetical protein